MTDVLMLRCYTSWGHCNYSHRVGILHYIYQKSAVCVVPFKRLQTKKDWITDWQQLVMIKLHHKNISSFTLEKRRSTVMWHDADTAPILELSATMRQQSVTERIIRIPDTAQDVNCMQNKSRYLSLSKSNNIGMMQSASSQRFACWSHRSESIDVRQMLVVSPVLHMQDWPPLRASTIFNSQTQTIGPLEVLQQYIYVIGCGSILTPHRRVCLIHSKRTLESDVLNDSDIRKVCKLQWNWHEHLTLNRKRGFTCPFSLFFFFFFFFLTPDRDWWRSKRCQQ